MRWYHGNMDVNTSSAAARQTVGDINRLRHNVEYKEYVGLDHFTLQGKVFKESMEWLQKSD